MARPDTSRFQTVRDDEIMVDRDGIPHYTGVMPHLMKEYKSRVMFAYAGLEGDGDTEEKETADLEKKRRRFAKRLIDALHGEAWNACQDLLKEPEKLRVPKGYELVFKALSSIEKETIIRKTEAFERFFDHSYRKRGQTIDSYLREKKQAWRELRDLDENSNMSGDLQAYFLLRGCQLNREDRRAILLANQSAYTEAGIEQALRISFHDLHEKERYRQQDDRSPKRKGYGKGKRSYAHAVEEQQDAWQDDWKEEDGYEEEYADEAQDAYEATEATSWQEEEQPSDQGASNDDDINEAYAAMDRFRKTYKDQRKKLKDLQKSRGFFRGEFTMEERNKQIAEEKTRSRCGACHRIGHWAGDAICPKTSNKPGKAKGKGKKGKKSTAAANVVSDTPFPTFFTLTQDDLADYANMVGDEDERNEMPVDGGDDGLRRRTAAPRSSEVSTPWEEVSAATGGYAATGEIIIGGVPYRPVTTDAARDDADVMRAAGMQVHPIHLSAEERVRPDIQTMRVAILQELCITNEIAYSGLNKGQLIERLNKFYDGGIVPKRNSSRAFVKMARLEDEVRSEPAHMTPQMQSPVTPLPKSSARARAIPVLAQMDRMRDQWSPASAPNMAGPHGRFTEDEGFLEGIPIYHLLCESCRAPMIGRRNRHDGGKFYGCTNFSPKGCKFTMTYEEGVERFRSSLSELHEHVLDARSSGSGRF